MKFKELDKYTKFAIITIIIGILIRFSLASIYHVSGDACWQLSVGRFIANNGNIPLFEGLGRNEPFWAPPLFHIITAFIYNFFNLFNSNIANFSIKFISPFFGSITLIFSYLIFRKFLDKKVSFYSILFLTFIPLHLDYSVFGYVEAALTFFVVLSIYLALENKVFLSSIAAGLAILTKYNGLFVLPLLIYIFYYKNKGNNKLILKKVLLITLIPILMATPWFLRNYLLLGNPIWPFLNFIFQGFEKASFSGFDITRLFHINALLFTYLGFFGVPDGNPQTLFLLKVPFIKLLISIWLISTFIFIIPIFFGFKFKKIVKNNLLIWILSYLFLMLLYIPNVGWFVSRMFLPAIPALALVWGVGFNKIGIKLKNLKKYFNLLIMLIIVGFVLGGFFKLTLASNSWNFYNDDFDWIKSNTNDNSLFLAGGQCLPFNIERQALYPEGNNLEKVDYAFVNQDFKLDGRVLVSEEQLSEIKAKGEIVYNNDKTKTEVYRIIS